MSFEYPFPPTSYEDDGRLMADIERQYISNVRTAENKAMIHAVREWAKTNGNVTFLEIPEGLLLKILQAGVKELGKIADLPDVVCPHCGEILRSDLYEE